MDTNDKEESTGIDRTASGAILGASCSTGMAVAAGIVGVGLAPAIAIALVGAVIGAALFSETKEDDEQQ